MREGSGSIRLTNESGRPKNNRIRISNTARKALGRQMEYQTTEKIHLSTIFCELKSLT
jgi:hypothetical protein